MFLISMLNSMHILLLSYLISQIKKQLEDACANVTILVAIRNIQLLRPNRCF